ncbi:MAG TPA: hypothetical protein VKQ72_05100 [Aggregatilineales bacterium]|nr:hypothetical protein [Aggregatilineales bacterium]
MLTVPETPGDPLDQRPGQQSSEQPKKKFRQRIVNWWQKAAALESDDVFDLAWTHRQNVEWEIDKQGRYHFNVPRVILEYSPRRWRVGREDWAATLEFGLNILAAYVDDSSAWLLHEAFCAEFLVETSSYEIKPGCWRILSAEIQAWLVIQTKGRAITYGPPLPLWTPSMRHRGKY